MPGQHLMGVNYDTYAVQGMRLLRALESSCLQQHSVLTITLDQDVVLVAQGIVDGVVDVITFFGHLGALLVPR